MKIQTNQETIEAIKKIIETQAEHPDNIRIYVAGKGCSGPSFGLSLDDINQEEDLTYTESDVNFVMSKEIYAEVGDMSVLCVEGGYMVKPVVAKESACGSCGGGCS